MCISGETADPYIIRFLAVGGERSGRLGPEDSSLLPCLSPDTLLHCPVLRTGGSRVVRVYVFWQEGKRGVMSHIRTNGEMWWRRKRKVLKFYFRVLGAEINWQKAPESQLSRFGFVWIWNYLITFGDLIFIWLKKKVGVDGKKSKFRYFI